MFFRIAMPLARPTIATTAIFGFMGFWNAFTAHMLYIKTDTRSPHHPGPQSFQSQNAGTMWNQVMAAACISVVPIIIIYLIFNKFFPGRSPHGRREISLSGVGRMCGSATSLRPLFCPLGSIATAATLGG